MMKRKGRILLVTAAVLLSLLAGCGSGGGYDTAASSAAPAAPPLMTNQSRMETGGFDRSYEGAVMDEAMAEEPVDMEPEIAMDNVVTGGGGGEYGDAGLPPVTQRKIVTTYYLTMETTAYDDAVLHLSGVAQGYGGYIERSSVGGRSIYNEGAARYASFTLRIPTEKIAEFISGLDDRYNVINSQESSDDITDSYYDSTARMASLEEQRDRLKELRERNTEGADLQYLLQIEQEISYVNYQIESLYAMLQRMDKSVNLATIHIELQEVMTYQPVETLPQSFGERVGGALSNSWRNFVRSAQDSVIRIIWSAPYLIVNLFWFAIFGGIAFVIARPLVRRIKRRRSGRTDLPDEPRAAAESTASPPDDE